MEGAGVQVIESIEQIGFSFDLLSSCIVRHRGTESQSNMLDLNLFRERKGHDPDVIRKSQGRRFKSVDLVDKVIDLDQEWCQRQFELVNLRKEFNQINKEIGQLRIKEGELIKKAEEKKRLIAEKEAEVQEALAQLNSSLEQIGNLVHDSVPVSEDEANNEVVRSWGENRVEPELKNHVELCKLLGIADFEKGAKVAGSRAGPALSF